MAVKEKVSKNSTVLLLTGTTWGTGRLRDDDDNDNWHLNFIKFLLEPGTLLNVIPAFILFNLHRPL